MNYQQIYIDFIASRRLLTRSNKDVITYENHHIVPSSLGGGNEVSNLILLTLGEHFFAHKLLYKMYCTNKSYASKMITAVKRMVGSDRYIVPRYYYEHARQHFIDNHPGKLASVQNSIRSTLRETRLKNGFNIIRCTCGCGNEVKVSLNQDLVAYLPEHKPTKECLCGCGERITNKGQIRITGHDSKKYKCACGCGADTYLAYDRTKANIKLFVNGHNPHQYDNIRFSLSKTLSQMSSDAMKERMLNSTMKADHEARILAIRRGKASTIEVTNLDGTTETMFSDQVIDKLNLSWPQIKYRLNAHNGVLLDGRIVKLANKYTGVNKWKNK